MNLVGILCHQYQIQTMAFPLDKENQTMDISNRIYSFISGSLLYPELSDRLITNAAGWLRLASS